MQLMAVVMRSIEAISMSIPLKFHRKRLIPAPNSSLGCMGRTSRLRKMECGKGTVDIIYRNVKKRSPQTITPTIFILLPVSLITVTPDEHYYRNK
jgi:hypothetical protein